MMNRLQSRAFTPNAFVACAAWPVVAGGVHAGDLRCAMAVTAAKRVGWRACGVTISHAKRHGNLRCGSKLVCTP